MSANSIELTRLLGNPQVKAEELRDYELGYRSELTKTLSLDVSTFLSFYHHLETIEPQNPVYLPGSPLIIEIPFLYDNQAHAVDYGGELSLTWKAAPRWRISPGIPIFTPRSAGIPLLKDRPRRHCRPIFHRLCFKSGRC